MKKIFLFILIFAFSFISKAQFPIMQYIGSDSTIVKSKGGLMGRFAPIPFVDTTSANLSRITQYPGALIYTSGTDKYWYRNSTMTKWIEFTSSGGATTNIYNSNGALNSERTVDGDGNGIQFNSFRWFAIGADSVQFSLNSNVLRIFGISETQDTTTYKPLVINPITGKVLQSSYWIGGGGGSQTLQQVLTTGSTLTQNNTINTGGYKTTWSGSSSDTTVYDNSVLKLITRTNAWTNPGIILQSSDTSRRYISNFMPERMVFRKNGYYDPGCSTCGLDGHQFIWYTNATEGGVDTLVNNMGAHIGPNDKHFYLADQTDDYAGPGIPANRLLSVEKNGAGYFSWYNNPANNNPQVLVGFYPAWAISGYETYRMVIGGKLGVNDSAYFKKKAWFEDTVRYSKPTYHDTNTVYVKNLKNQNPGYADRRFVIGQDLAGGIGPEWSDGSLVGFYNQFGYHYLQSYGAPANGFWVGTYPGAWQEYKKDGRITFSTNTPTAQKFTFNGSGNFSDTLIAKTVGTADSSDVAATTKWVKQQGYGTGGGGGSGVTSVATNTATGITGGTITTTGTLAIDTILVGTRLWRQKGIDSVQGNITSGLSGKVNISDTAAMLAGYTRVQRFLDSLSNHTTRFNGVTTSLSGKVNVSDTATMLANYTRVQRFLDSLSSHTTRFNGVTSSLATKLNISDTASMLTNYTRVQRFLDSLSNHTTRFNGVTSSLALKLNISDTASMLTNYVRRQELKDTASAIRSAIGSSTSLTKGTTTISNSATRRILYDSSGVLSNNALFTYNSSGELQIGSASDLGAAALQVTGHLWIPQAENIYLGSTSKVITSDANSIYVNGNSGVFLQSASTTGAYVANNRLGVGAYFGNPTAKLHIDAGSTTANTAPLKFTSGSPTTTPEIGAVHFSNGLFIGDSSNSVRDTFATRSWARNNITSGSGSGVTTVGTINGVSKNANGAVISGSSIYMQTADATYPGLMSSSDKLRLDSNSYIQNVIRSGFDTLSRKKNDSILQIKAIQFVAGSNMTITPTITDTTLSYSFASTGGSGTVNVRRSIEKGTGDSLQLLNDSATFVNTAKVYGYSSSTRGWKDAAVINGVSLATGDHLEYNATSGEWDNKATMALTKVSITGATQDTVVLDDMVPFYDAAEGVNNKVRVDDLMHTYVRTFRRISAFDYINEFINTPTTTSNGNDLLATNSGTGAATATQATDAANRVGLVRTTTGTTATGRSYVNAAASSVRLGGGVWVYEIYVNLTTLSTSTERYQMLFGFFDTYTAANQVDGVYILYDEGGASTGSAASANWQLVTASNSTRTFSTSSTAVAATTWTKLRVEINAAGTRADFFVNDTNIGNITTNIPTGSGRELGFGWGMIKSVGTTARTLDVDYIMTTADYTTDK